MYFSLGVLPDRESRDSLLFAKFQISFRFELFDFYKGDRPKDGPYRGFNIFYTQTSFWDLTSRSQPFFDTSYKPGAFILWQQLGRIRSWMGTQN